MTTINVESDEPAQVLIRELRDADRIARDAAEKATAALADADRIAASVADLRRREDEIRAELARIAEHLDKLQRDEANARSYAAHQHTESLKKAAAVEGYKRLLSAMGVAVDEHLLVPTAPVTGNGRVTPPTRPMAEVDPTDARIDNAIARIDEARAELPEKHRDEGEL